MRYLLDKRYLLRGWQNAHTGVVDAQERTTSFLRKDEYLLLIRCDGVHDIDEGRLSASEREFLDGARRAGLIRPARFLELLADEQRYAVFPAPYKELVEWSVTGACNLRCRHCFMSAPQAKHGSPTFEQLVDVADQLAECGVFRAVVTGGEPCMRDDLLDLVDALGERGIAIEKILTNGWLLDEAFLDGLDARGVRTRFQLSFDGVGCHDFLRGVPGAEERTVRAIGLLRERGHEVTTALCLHRGNRHALRESVNLMASLGVSGMKCGAAMELGDWASPELRDLQLAKEEELSVYEQYIPLYFADGAPLPIELGGAFAYRPGETSWSIPCLKACPAEDEGTALSCDMLAAGFFVGADGMVCPCMGMADCGYARNFPNLFETPLREILGSEDFTRLCHVTVGEVKKHNLRCRECAHAERCAGGCRMSALVAGDDYYGADPDNCRFFESDGERRITRAAEGPFAAYLGQRMAGGGEELR